MGSDSLRLEWLFSPALSPSDSHRLLDDAGRHLSEHHRGEVTLGQVGQHNNNGLACVGISSVLATSDITHTPVPISDHVKVTMATDTNSTVLYNSSELRSDIAANSNAMDNISTGDQLFGIAVILAGQVVCAVQYVVRAHRQRGGPAVGAEGHRPGD